jgi:hypothetical protein
MGDAVDIYTRQRVVIEFFTTEGSSPIKTHRHLRSMYGEDAIDFSSVRRWVHRFRSSEKGNGHSLRSGQPATAVTTETKYKVDFNEL